MEEEKQLPRWLAHFIGIALGLGTFWGLEQRLGTGDEATGIGFLALLVYGLTLMVTRGGLMGQALSLGFFLFYGIPIIGGIVIGGEIGQTIIIIWAVVMTVMCWMAIFHRGSKSREGRASVNDIDGGGGG